MEHAGTARLNSCERAHRRGGVCDAQLVCEPDSDVLSQLRHVCIRSLLLGFKTRHVRSLPRRAKEHNPSAREHVGIASGRATGSNLVKQPFQYHGLLIGQSWCCFREQKHVDPVGRRLELSL